MELWWLDPAGLAPAARRGGILRVQAYGWFDRSPLLPGAADSVWVARAASNG